MKMATLAGPSIRQLEGLVATASSAGELAVDDRPGTARRSRPPRVYVRLGGRPDQGTRQPRHHRARNSQGHRPAGHRVLHPRRLRPHRGDARLAAGYLSVSRRHRHLCTERPRPRSWAWPRGCPWPGPAPARRHAPPVVAIDGASYPQKDRSRPGTQRRHVAAGVMSKKKFRNLC